MKVIKIVFTIGIVLTSVILFSAASNPRITWAPVHLVKEPIIGTSSTQQITFTSDTALSNVVVEVVPELRPFVKVYPASFATIPANVSKTITVAFDVPESTGSNPVSGTIRLVSGSGPRRTYARPLPVTLNFRNPTAEFIPGQIALPSEDRIVVSPYQENVIYAKNEIVIMLNDGAAISDITPLIHELGIGVLGSIDDVGIFQIRVESTNLDEIILLAGIFAQHPAVAVAMPHTLFQFATEKPGVVGVVESPNDPGSLNSWVYPSINLGDAWQITTGRTWDDPMMPGPKIAIVDSGFDLMHQDLRNNISTIPLSSLDLTTRERKIHGTAMAGIVGAEGNNAIGITGVMWNASLMPYTAHYYGGPVGSLIVNSSSPLSVIEQSQLAALEGAQVINLSLGVECFFNGCGIFESPQIIGYKAIFQKYFQLNSSILWVIAAGNQDVNVENSVPASLADNLENVISVGAVSEQLDRAFWGTTDCIVVNYRLRCDNTEGSNYGAGLTIYAPGENVPILSPGTDDPGFATGTSVAAPLVTGVAGLMISVNPSLTPAETKNIIKCTSRPTGNSDPDGNEIKLLDAYEAVRIAELGNVCRNEPEFGSVSVTATLDGNQFSGAVNYDIVGPNGVVIGTSTPGSTADLPVGEYRVVYRDGGPSNSLFSGITPSETQILTVGQELTFTINFSTIPCAPKPSNMVAWWRGEGNAQDSIATNHGTLVNGAGFTSGKVGQGFSLNGAGQFINIPHAASLNPQFELTTEVWIKLDQLPPVVPGGAGWLVVGKDNPQAGPYALGVNSDGSVGFGAYILGPGWRGVNSPPGAVIAGEYLHIAGTYSSSGQQFCVYVNGQATCSAIGCCLRNTTNPVKIGANIAWGQYLKGIVDEVSIYDRALSSSEIGSIYSAGGSGKCVGN